MKTITTLAAIAALTTLAACGTAEAPAEAVATEAAANEAAATEAAPAATEVGASAADRVEAVEPGTQPK
jgi:predicted small lipoprotein YifL